MYAIVLMPLLSVTTGWVDAHWAAPEAEREWVLRVEPRVLDQLSSGRSGEVASIIKSDQPCPQRFRIRFFEEAESTHAKTVSHESTPGIQRSIEFENDEGYDKPLVRVLRIAVDSALVDSLKTGKIEILEAVPKDIRRFSFVVSRAEPEKAKVAGSRADDLRFDKPTFGSKVEPNFIVSQRFGSQSRQRQPSNP